MLAGLLEEYRAKNRKSLELFERARKNLPGGNTRTSIFVSPFPCYADHGERQYVVDVDGNKRVDFNLNMTSLILGHADHDVVKALQDQAARGTAFAAPTALELEWAGILVERVPSVEAMRFANSGTEGTLNAIRAAKAFNGKRKVAKFEGGYHGSHEYAEWSVKPPSSHLSGPIARPRPVPDTAGVSEAIRQEVIVLPFNNLDATAEIIRAQRNDLACVIIEPVQGSAGVIPARPDFLQGLRQVTAESDVLLIFDEVISFRTSAGGAQARYGVVPDLTAFGKVIGGGLPVGGVGGRRDIMQVFDPSGGTPVLSQAGTFNGNPMTAVAGITTLKKLAPPAYEHLNRLGQRARDGLTALFRQAGVPWCVSGVGSLFQIHAMPDPPTCIRDTWKADRDRLAGLFYWLHNNGVIIVPRGMGAISVPMAEADIDRLIQLTADFVKA